MSDAYTVRYRTRIDGPTRVARFRVPRFRRTVRAFNAWRNATVECDDGRRVYAMARSHARWNERVVRSTRETFATDIGLVVVTRYAITPK